jgi:protein-S-isoprenylcysteine O-methyltransferase Ste14
MLVVGAEVLLGGALVLTLVSGVRVWPPPGRRSWQYRLMWSLTWLAIVGFLILGIVDWDSFVFDHWIRFPVGGSMVAAGLGLVGWGVRSLGMHTTSGLDGELVTTGAFRYSRNPQYLGEMIWILGYAVVTNSVLTIVAGFFGCLLFVLMPFTEEPWLRDRYGVAFDQYAALVPRFVGRATSRA